MPMNQKSISEELEDLRNALAAVILDCNFPHTAPQCLLSMVNAGELDIAFENLLSNISDFRELAQSEELRERLAAIRKRLDLLPRLYR
ncbi:Hypothetical protein CAP_3864 [Chondromyces apiculatus DSM 436]|uniref:Uncharacterized protein n=2 Tax=Chondromyces apiculatus TaxID=51 RepID=A0A017T6D7_9BACT|nr:Hypothetical protein CAP_3864 [Chondromyces apiculatus DSM 436]